LTQVWLARPHPNNTPVVSFLQGVPARVITPHFVGRLTPMSQQMSATVNEPDQNAMLYSPRPAATTDTVSAAKIARTSLAARSFLVALPIYDIVGTRTRFVVPPIGY
jgi:hypothetical protein